LESSHPQFNADGSQARVRRRARGSANRALQPQPQQPQYSPVNQTFQQPQYSPPPPPPQYPYQQDQPQTGGGLGRWFFLGCGCLIVLCIVLAVVAGVFRARWTVVAHLLVALLAGGALTAARQEWNHDHSPPPGCVRFSANC